MAFTPKWLVRAGALLVMLGFFLPSMMVSCTGLGSSTPVGEFSLADLADGSQIQQSEGILYLVFVGMLVAFIASFLPMINREWEKFMPLVEAGSIGMSLFILIVEWMKITSNTGKMGLTYELLYGAYVLMGGYFLTLIGVILEFTGGSMPKEMADSGKPEKAITYQSPQEPAWQNQASQPQYQNQVNSARLELVSGALPVSIVPVGGTDFTIGRSSANNLSIPDPKVSRMHVRLRYAQGAWFIQDQNSALGTYVNGQRVHAGRLNAGDHLGLGDVVFIFKC